ncbi:MAG TPA: protein kinase, partial [Bryobacteraceae bacterium]|nr:protein kinase [Bryobacteraceae bacterium]
DTRLGREVALKVLPEAFARDAERLGRFRREAQVLASLNHPNIAAIYGFEDSGGVHALAMELVAGPTLAERIKAGAMPLEEALPIARQICEALEYAHERGVIHRDLKPANVKITPDGAVKILDFGLAKALEGDAASVDISTSPTISRMATQAGIILGTAAYMSPEQAKGKSVDRRTDIWAFGCVLYEMLAGKMAFSGETVTDTLAAVIRAEPDWNALPAATPQTVRNLLQRCLKKDGRQRLQSIGDARVALEEILSGAAGQSDSATAGGIKPPLQTWRRVLPWATAVPFAIVAILFAAAYFLRAPRSAEIAPIELSLEIPSNQKLLTNTGPAAILSPDGSRLAYVAQSASGDDQIYVREMDKSEATPLEGAVGTSPFFSPDGQWIGFYSPAGELEKVSVFGGTPVALCDAAGRRGGSWADDETIVFTPAITASLYRVSANGGTPSPVTRLDKTRKEVTHRWPQILPGGKDVLFTASANNNDFDHADIEAVSLSTGRATVLVENAYFGRYLPAGYLTYISGGTLFAVPFDAKHLKLSGTAMPALTNLRSDLTNGSAQISFSLSGTAVYLAGSTVASQVTVDLFDRKGVAVPLVKQAGDYYSPAFSPDGKRLALQVGPGISVYDMARGAMTPLVFAPNTCIRPAWTPDSKRIACESESATGIRISWLPSDGTGSLKPLSQGTGLNQVPTSWTPNGGTLAFFQNYPKTGGCCEIGILPVSPEGVPGKASIILGEGGLVADSNPEISPDGRWLAYQSREAGVPQVYVVPFPGLEGKWQVSVTGGRSPVWSKATHELFFLRDGANAGMLALYAVPYTVEGNSFRPGQPRMLFQGGFESRDPYPSYDAAPDGKHFAMFRLVAGASAAAAPANPTVVIHWSTRVAQLVSVGQK